MIGPVNNQSTRYLVRSAEFATLVVHHLNTLSAEPCCPDCCAPCGIVQRLADFEELDGVVRMAPPELVDGSAWWAGGVVDVGWLRSRWACQSNPPCAENTNGGAALSGRRCTCLAYDPVENAHAEDEHSSCGNLGSYGGGSLPCGGCDDCLSAQVDHYRRQECGRDAVS